MIIAIDIDDTITAIPSFFSLLSKAVIKDGGKVIIISSRPNLSETIRLTGQELKEYDVTYSKLVLMEGPEVAKSTCPHMELDWWEKYLWQKVDICQKEKVDIVFEDDEKVVELFKKFAPEIQVFRVIK